MMNMTPHPPRTFRERNIQILTFQKPSLLRHEGTAEERATVLSGTT